VEETALAETVTGHEPLVPYEGTYTGTGHSQYHVWLVNDAGEKIDCSQLPQDYNRAWLWEPHEVVPELTYTERAETTRAVLDAIARVYGGG
jgi:hypothetical protein